MSKKNKFYAYKKIYYISKNISPNTRLPYQFPIIRKYERRCNIQLNIKFYDNVHGGIIKILINEILYIIRLLYIDQPSFYTVKNSFGIN